ncbi:MAG: hypothetical protein U0744_17880 [Gemmataceae bacterium]
MQADNHVAVVADDMAIGDEEAAFVDDDAGACGFLGSGGACDLDADDAGFDFLDGFDDGAAAGIGLGFGLSLGGKQ